MRRLSILIITMILLIGASCQNGDSSRTMTQPGRGALALEVAPNPIVAQRVSGDKYDFPFTISLREVGGVAVHVDRVSIEVRGPGGIRFYTEILDRAEIARKGYPTSIEAGGQIRYQLNPRKDVPSDLLFGSVYADLTVEATDGNGEPARAQTRVTVERE
ncbi:MAG TPA: hypothetical protein VIL97_02515 [Thermoanaerobaculia bacterium]